MRHTISVLVQNRFGVLARVAGLFSARGYNIASLAVSETTDPAVSYMTMVVEARDEKVLEQIKKQLHKLIDVITVSDFTNKPHVDRELVIIKVCCCPKTRSKIEAVLHSYVGKLISCRDNVGIIEAVGDQAQIKKLLDEMKEYNIIELVRTGRVAMSY